ncbi:Vicilin GC72-A precursor, putative [Ricinus communis]|uniref:Vicilin GC72-A, putative n=1 Tax=Ricinus communis TaxID=3988 RepID=B9RTM9_RICCO|nr:Vicilin GC72-A precursor, putative [Ricinus communis]|eukprot:XP_002517098.1 vicilin-like antimicrobial peptides 2-2 [Ricinus communis]
MSIRAKPPSFMFLLIFLFLSYGLQSLGYEVPYPQTGKERCLQRCDEIETEVSGLVSCAVRCEHQYGDKGNGNKGGDPKSPRWEIERCQQRCRREGADQRELQKCQQRCEEEPIKEREREQEKGQERQPREHELDREKSDDPRKQYERCLEICERQEGRQKQQCKRRCYTQYEEQQKEWEEREHGGGGGNSETETRSREIEQHKNNPYYFHAQRLRSPFKTDEGHIRVLEKFSESSELLRGIENYRLLLLDAVPNTFIVPNHFDAESLVVVLNGKCTISYVLREKRVSYNLETGDVIKIPAGATVYMSNHDNNEMLRLATLIQPVNIPGEFSSFSAAGGGNLESFYTVFSNDVLEAALDTPRDQLDKLFGQQRQGVIVKAPQKQLKALSQRVSSTRQKGQAPLNLRNQQPLYSNRYGNLWEASPNDHKQLQDMDVSVSYAEIKRGSLMVPHYNSRTTTIGLVLEGSGRVEMACPHVASQKQKESQQEQETKGGAEHYRKISSNLSPGGVFIMPAGHPTALLASQNENLLTLWFGINASNNHRNFLAGQRDNVMNQIEIEAKELSFNVPAELIEKIFRNQKESHFVAGPQQGQRQQREEGRGHSIPSILDFPGFF